MKLNLGDVVRYTNTTKATVYPWTVRRPVGRVISYSENGKYTGIHILPHSDPKGEFRRYYEGKEIAYLDAKDLELMWYFVDFFLDLRPDGI